MTPSLEDGFQLATICYLPLRTGPDSRGIAEHLPVERQLGDEPLEPLDLGFQLAHAACVIDLGGVVQLPRIAHCNARSGLPAADFAALVGISKFTSFSAAHTGQDRHRQ